MDAFVFLVSSILFPSFIPRSALPMCDPKGVYLKWFDLWRGFGLKVSRCMIAWLSPPLSRILSEMCRRKDGLIFWLAQPRQDALLLGPVVPRPPRTMIRPWMGGRRTDWSSDWASRSVLLLNVSSTQYADDHSFLSGTTDVLSVTPTNVLSCCLRSMFLAGLPFGVFVFKRWGFVQMFIRAHRNVFIKSFFQRPWSEDGDTSLLFHLLFTFGLWCSLLFFSQGWRFRSSFHQA